MVLGPASYCHGCCTHSVDAPAVCSLPPADTAGCGYGCGCDDRRAFDAGADRRTDAIAGANAGSRARLACGVSRAVSLLAPAVLKWPRAAILFWLTVFVLIAGGWLVWSLVRRTLFSRRVERALRDFVRDRDEIQAEFLKTAGASGKPRGLAWKQMRFSGRTDYSPATEQRRNHRPGRRDDQL